MTNIIELRNLKKEFASEPVLKGVNLQLREHTVLGLLGVNGAGKTTLLRCALGLLKPGAGEALIYGREAWNMPPEIKSKIGFVPQIPDLLEWMNVGQMLNYTAAFYQRWDTSYAESLLSGWELKRSTPVNSLSEGQKQRLAIVLAMGYKPDVLILDEPVAALDPVARRDFIRQLIELNVDYGKTILFSTHIVSDLERIAAEVAIMKEGRIDFQGEIDSLKEKVVKLKILSRQKLPTTLKIPNMLSSKISENTATLCVTDFHPEQLDTLQTELNASIQMQSLGLEDIFLEVNQKEVNQK